MSQFATLIELKSINNHEFLIFKTFCMFCKWNLLEGPQKQLNSAIAYTRWLFLLTGQARSKTLTAAKSLLINCERDYETRHSSSHLCPLWNRIDVAPPRSTRHQKYLLGWCPGRRQAMDWDSLATSGPGLKTPELHKTHPYRGCLITSFFLSNIKSFITVWLNLQQIAFHGSPAPPLQKNLVVKQWQFFACSHWEENRIWASSMKGRAGQKELTQDTTEHPQEALLFFSKAP